MQQEKHPLGLLSQRREERAQGSLIAELLDRAIETRLGLARELLGIEGAESPDHDWPEAVENSFAELATDGVVEISRRRGELLIAPAQTEAAKSTNLGVLASPDRGAETGFDLGALDGVDPGGTAERQDRVGVEILLGHKVINNASELCIALRPRRTGPDQGLDGVGRIRTSLDDCHGAATEVG